MTATSAATLDTPLAPVESKGWTGGIGNLVRKELRQWWGTRLWWIQILVWVVLLNGVSMMIMLDNELGPAALVEEAVKTFMQVGAAAIAIGVVLTVQGAIVGEKELGTAAWVISKPVSRASFVLAKLIGHSVGFLITALLVPAVVFIIQAEVLLPLPLSYWSFLSGLGVLALAVVFYLVLTLALGTLFEGRGPVAGIGIGLILMGQFFKGMLPETLVLITPWLLGDVAASVAMDSPVEFNRLLPIMATAVATVLLTFVGLWRFKREEF